MAACWGWGWGGEGGSGRVALAPISSDVPLVPGILERCWKDKNSRLLGPCTCDSANFYEEQIPGDYGGGDFYCSMAMMWGVPLWRGIGDVYWGVWKGWGMVVGVGEVTGDIYLARRFPKQIFKMTYWWTQIKSILWKKTVRTNSNEWNILPFANQIMFFCKSKKCCS